MVPKKMFKPTGGFRIRFPFCLFATSNGYQVAGHNAFALGNGMGEIGEESGEGLAVASGSVDATGGFWLVFFIFF
jgi:biotin transporter BioY